MMFFTFSELNNYWKGLQLKKEDILLPKERYKDFLYKYPELSQAVMEWFGVHPRATAVVIRGISEEDYR